MATFRVLDGTQSIPRTPVQMNNSALALFLSGNYGHAIEELTVAYALWLQRVQQHRGIICPLSAKNSSSRSTGTLLSHCPGGVGSVEEDISMTDDRICTHDTPMNDCQDDYSSAGLPDTTRRPLHEAASPQETLDSSSGIASSSNILSIPCCPMSTSAFAVSLRSASQTVSGSALTMYNRALVLSLSDDEDKFLARTGAIIMYNLALVHHNVGLHLGLSTSLWEALQLYEQALGILDRSMPKHVASQNPTTTTQQLQASIGSLWRVMNVEKLLLAILNNMGNIHAHLFHKENTSACMKSLRLVLEISTARGCPSSSSATGNAAGHDNHTTSATSTPPFLPSAIIDEDYVFFLLNSLFQEKFLCLAPAA